MNFQLPTSETTGAIETIATHSGVRLLVEKHSDGRRIAVSLRAQTGRRCVLHWGVRRNDQPDWQILPQALWPEGTTASAGARAMQTPFKKQNGEGSIAIALSSDAPFGFIEFVLFFPDEKWWDNNDYRNYQIVVPPAKPEPGPSPLATLKVQFGEDEVLLERVFEVENCGHLAAGVTRAGDRYQVLLLADIPGPLTLHWGVAQRSPHEWLQPPESLRPPGTVLLGGHTAHTPFTTGDGLERLVWDFPVPDAPLGIQFVLKQGHDGRWLNHRGGNFYVPIIPATAQRAPLLDAEELADLASQIIRAEISPSSWTLMHRFNLCYDLLDRVRGNVNGLALLYVWLRFSAIRQLTWQRNYNTKPRELTHAQDRLTGKLAEIHRTEPDARPLVRLMLATVGRGGDGQRIRDEVLQIMHCHHIKEVSGHFLEEWHQKLHNNTTPDDVVICEAYLDFLRSDGDLEQFYRTLQDGGVTRERLESFERPIRTNPDFVPHLKGALIHDFENFLRVLKAIHSSTDLETAINSARDRLDGDTQDLLTQIWNRRNDPAEALAPLVNQITESRRRVSSLLNNGDGLRQLLYLDLALEQLVRVVVERNIHLPLRDDQLADLTGCVLENVTLSYEDAELAACLRHWERLQTASAARWATGRTGCIICSSRRPNFSATDSARKAGRSRCSARRSFAAAVSVSPFLCCSITLTAGCGRTPGSAPGRLSAAAGGRAKSK
jgi:alpha-glucan,water dikinase